jgi:predicted nucleic acid-binding Zn ribbon protein
VRRLGPRSLRLALEDALPAAVPAGLLGPVQAAWPAVAGPAVAEEAEPVSEREGVVTVACRAAVWAQELELLGGDLTARLNARLAASGSAARVARLRFVVREP